MSYNKETRLYEGCIYKITNNLNGKIYIGQTKQKLNKRISQHVTNSKLMQSHSIIDQAIKKYGIANFSVDILCNCADKTKSGLTKELNKMENFFISAYNSFTESNNYNILSGGTETNNYCVAIDQYTINGEYIRSFDAIIDATDFNGLDESAFSNISACCNGRRNTAYGYVWRYKGDDYGKYPVKTMEYKKVNKYSCDGEYIATYKSITDAGRSVDNTHSAHHSASVVRNGLIYGYKSYGYKWYYAHDPNQPDKTKIISQ